ncbi:uncharacterized protein [Euphorbia lathyris]|uniref:uncharacterized protein n=1 Tax=Euphorbia lathyris TaxID=212925 RepID=UPI0033137197
MEETGEKSLTEKREELMASSTTKRKQMAHFLNPTHTSIKPSFPKNPKLLSSSLPSTSDSKTKPVKVTLRGWRNISTEWGSWVQHLEDSYHSVWKRAGIYEAIISSTFKFQRDNDVIIGLAEKWCLDINTFIFPWAEATITLEDIMVLGGYSVFGSPVFGTQESKELEEIEEKLKAAKTEFCNRKAWIAMFMCSGSDIEHEAFLSLWLERFVFNDSSTKLQDQIFSIAIHLAKGEVFALAPAVLASIYRDLGLLKTTILAATEFKENENSAHKLALTLCSPLHLVQLWAWERFPAFQPHPNVINNDDPRSALWKNVKNVRKSKCVRSDFDSAGEDFVWQPYLHGLHLHKLHKEKGQWKRFGLDLLAYALCLRVSELVGLDCVQQYLPHRVARQFGLDQDIPSDIARTEVLPDLAWSNYIRPFNDTKVYVPSHFSKPDVTIRYSDWWNRMGIDSEDRIKDTIFNPVRRKRSSISRSKRVPQASIGQAVESIIQADVAIEPVEVITQADDAIGIPLNELKEEPETETRIVSNIDEYSSGEVPGLALEARIGVLEEMVAKLKAARGYKN